MNSFSTQNYKDDSESFSESNKLSTLFLKCGNSGSAIINFFSLPTAFPSITLNTSHLSNSCVKFNFTSNVYSINAFIGTLKFQLFKQCNNQIGAISVGPQWTFSREGLFDDISTFSFPICDCDICSSTECIYYVVVSPSSIGSGTVVITNATLSAIAVDNSSFKQFIINDKDKHCFKPPLELNPVILKCRAPKSTLFPSRTNENLTTTSTVASVAVNTSHFYNPCIMLEFASTIIQPTNAFITNMVFQVFKKCFNNSQQISVGPQWSYFVNRTPPHSSNFSFFVCDCNTTINECCTYTVQATVNTVSLVGSGFATVNNATLSALVVDNANENC